MGVVIALTILVAWAAHLVYILAGVEIDYASPWFYFHILLQTYLYTGLFITGHDAMHGVVSSNRPVNQAIGYTVVFLYAGMWYRKLIRYHGMHHQFPGTERDPDYSTGSQNFFVWWFRFMIHYITWIQLLIMAALYNILTIWLSDRQVILFWVLPAVLSTFQLFYFGTYVPHKRPHTAPMGPHKARTLAKSHLLAMITCYFFGYHREHHESPRTPWWQLYRLKS
ncbi:MAG: fatty acid desaturase [Bacteroidales bacterium]|jgi:beta-carotene ketolase (CrtW type)|nr:fatty acid desaturase [Bacteroidales bacterium]